MERKLVGIAAESGRWPTVPVRHHARLLERFGLNDLTDLPKVEDMSDLLGFELPTTVGEPAPQSRCVRHGR